MGELSSITIEIVLRYNARNKQNNKCTGVILDLSVSDPVAFSASTRVDLSLIVHWARNPQADFPHFDHP